MDITDILEIRILPPFAIGRLGSSPTPMENYTVTSKDPVGYRKIEPAETLIIDPETGEICERKRQEEVRFKDRDERIKPVSPFLEVWARFETNGLLVPLTLTHLQTLGLSPSAVQWRVHVGNHKAARRTADPNDKIEAQVGPFGDHAERELQGVCNNFLPEKSLPLGRVRYIKPTEAFPEIRFRFIPACGKVYGPEPDDGGKDRNLADIVYDKHKGRWKGYFDPDNAPANTNPGAIYYGTPGPKDTDFWISAGYLDDECDGIVEAELSFTRPGETHPKHLTAFARIAAGPPTFAPDSFPIRTVGDELDQALHGPDVTDPVTQPEVEDIVRRALDTVRLMNTGMLNRSSPDRGVGMARMDTADVNRAPEPIMDPTVVDTIAVRGRHERVLLALESGTLTWFARALRNYNEVGDLSDAGRRKMPALMRSADARHLALTRRQVNKVRRAAQQLEALDANQPIGADETPREEK
ncbi:MAG: hypothetical protein JWN14_4511 [Chthonomonadales bacterium]|nr:hypothetical protein [Chthonomonadales bacterium]